MRIEVFTICWNEAWMLPHFMRHYTHFASRIVVYDNGSTDGSQDIVRRLGGELRHYETNGEQDNEAMRRVKNECWKGSRADWAIVCDVDEFLVGHRRLTEFSPWAVPAPVFLCESYQMVSEQPPEDLRTVTRGMRSEYFDKCLCFSPRIESINYAHGGHQAVPVGGEIIPGVLKLHHYVFLGEDYVVNRWKRYVPRMSQRDKDNRWGGHYLLPEDAIRKTWRKAWREAVDLDPIP